MYTRAQERERDISGLHCSTVTRSLLREEAGTVESFRHEMSHLILARGARISQKEEESLAARCSISSTCIVKSNVACGGQRSHVCQGQARPHMTCGIVTCSDACVHFKDTHTKKQYNTKTKKRLAETVCWQQAVVLPHGPRRAGSLGWRAAVCSIGGVLL